MKIVMAQLNFKVGALVQNTERIISTIESYKSRTDIDFLVFSETAITGYPPLDLVKIPGFVDEQMVYLKKIKQSTRGMSFHVVIGCITKNLDSGKPLHNSLVVIHDGLIQLEYDKVLLPTYNIFDERRYFEPGTSPNFLHYKGKTIAFLICEDAWANKSGDLYRKNPVEDTFNGGLNEVDVLITINASPSNIGKRHQRMEVYSDICTAYKIPLVYVNQVGGNDGIMFDGGSFVMDPRGQIISMAKSFEEECVEVDLDDSFKPGTYSIPSDQFIYEQLKMGLREYVNKVGFKGVVIGESGGIDSAVVTALAVDALGADRVKAITMPSHVSSEGSVTDSEILCKNLGVQLFNFPIKNNHQNCMKQFDETFSHCGLEAIDTNKVTEQNNQSRERGKILMNFSNRFGYLVLNTGNKSELSVGYFTLGGDSMGGIAPIGDLYKMQVYALGRYYNYMHGAELIPNVILDKEPSAELEVGQVDSRDLPTYPVLDAMLKLYVEHLEMPAKEYHECMKVLKDKSSPEEINKVLRKVTFNEHKRAVVPKCIRVNSVAYGFGWQMPIAQGYVPTVNAISIKE